jgi:antitoxin component YwqK of YwqJK toxin-antitoxin module
MGYKLFLSFLLIGTFFVSNPSYANEFYALEQQDNGVNVIDVNGKKQGKWVYLGKDRPDLGYPLEGKIEEGTYKDDRKEGEWIKYHHDGVTPRLRGYYINNRPQGEYVKYHPNGKVKEKGSFERNKYIDSLTRFTSTGQLEYQAVYNAEGKEDGKVKYYYANGELEFEYTSNNGNLVGEAVRYYENGDVKEILEYGPDGTVMKREEKEMVNPSVKVVNPNASREKAPKAAAPKTKGVPFLPQGYNKVYNDNDEIWLDGIFKNGNLWEGKVYEYDKDGILLKVKVFKEGVYHSDGQL